MLPTAYWWALSRVLLSLEDTCPEPQQSVIMIKAQIRQPGARWCPSLSFVVLSVLLSHWRAPQAVTQEVRESQGRCWVETRAGTRPRPLTGASAGLIDLWKEIYILSWARVGPLFVTREDEQPSAASPCTLDVFYAVFPHSFLSKSWSTFLAFSSLLFSRWQPAIDLLSSVLKTHQMMDPTPRVQQLRRRRPPPSHLG